MKSSQHLDIDQIVVNVKTFAEHETPQYIQARIKEVLQDVLSTHMAKQSNVLENSQFADINKMIAVMNKPLLANHFFSELKPMLPSVKQDESTSDVVNIGSIKNNLKVAANG